MSEIILNPASQQLVDTYLQQPAHGLLLSGQRGVGLMTTARMIAGHIAVSGNIHEVHPDERGTITIEAIRGLYTLTRTHRSTPLVISIDDADLMSREAQHALLKLLEEPAGQTCFILTTHVPHSLLPTILSRTQRITLLPVTAAMTERMVADRPKTVQTQLLFLASGLPAELMRLLADEEYFARRTAHMRDARRFLEGDQYTRLVLAKQYGADRTLALEFLGAVSKMLAYTLFTQQQTSHISSLEIIEEVVERLHRNAHVRTQLLYLVSAFH